MNGPYQYALGRDMGDISQQAENVHIYVEGYVAWSSLVLIMHPETGGTSFPSAPSYYHWRALDCINHSSSRFSDYILGLRSGLVR